MKKIFLIATTLMFLFSACEQEPGITPTETAVTVSLSQTSSSNTGLSTVDEVVSITVSNNSTKDATISWNRTETQSVTGWTYMVNGNADSSGTLSILAGASTTISFLINPNDSIGNGTGDLTFYDAIDSSTTSQTFSYDYTSIASWFTLIPIGLMNLSIASSDPTTDYRIYVNNDNNIPVNVTWEREDNSSNPTGWSLLVCTDAACYVPSVITETFTIAPNTYVDFKLSIDHNFGPSNLGSGGSTAKFYVVADSANSYKEQAIVHEVTF